VSVLRLFLLRHGETTWSRERRFSGTREVPLTPDGVQQADAVAAALADIPLEAVYASPLSRARLTAEAVAMPHGLPVRIEPRLIEMSFGAWEGLTGDEAAGLHPELFARWRSAPGDVVPPGGETLRAINTRVMDVVGELQRAHPDGTVAVVTHAVVVRLIVLSALGLDADRLWAVDASPAGLSEIEYRPGWVSVHRMNTISHLDRTITAPPPQGVPA
jgi:broad specificity phosphatase PhoE